MARQLIARRYTYQPQGTSPRLRGPFADAVFIYLPTIAIRQARWAALTLDSGTEATQSHRLGYLNTFFDDSSIKAAANTLGLAFSKGMTVLTVGSYENTGSGIRNIVNRANAGTTGGFNVNYFNAVGAGAFIYSSYNHPSTGDTNWDSAWVNGVKDSTGNGSFATSTGTRYAFAGTAAVGPNASATTEIIIGKESLAGQPGGQVNVEMVVIWPRKFPEQLMAQITRDPYSIFQPQVRLASNTIAGDITVGLTGVSSTTSIVGPLVSVSKALTGLSATGSIGTIVPNIGLAVASYSTTTSINNPTYSNSPSLGALSATGSVGAVTANTSSGNLTIGVTGVSSTLSIGTLVPGLSKQLSSNTLVMSMTLVGSSGGTPVTVGDAWQSVAFHPSETGFPSVVPYTSETGNESV